MTPITFTLDPVTLVDVEAAAARWDCDTSTAAARLLARGLSALAGSAAGGRAGSDRPARAKAAANARWRRQAKAALRPTR